MYLAHVDVKNFRCLRDLQVELRQGLNVLVGRNNVGKTSLLAAIRHALGTGPSRGDPLWLTEDDFYRPAPGTARATELSVSLTFRGLTEVERTAFYEIIDFDHADLANSPAVVRFRASWNESKGRAVVHRTGGPAGANAPDVPSEVLAALSVTFLPALRNAEEHLAPGPRSRLALMLRDVARRGGGDSKATIEGIFDRANADLETDDLITGVRDSLRRTTQSLSGTDYAEPTIRASGVDFDRILRTLQVHVPGAPVEGLHANGLGYNNLLYMAVVLEHLRLPAEDECQLLMVEEPEAHLHPQLTALLAEYLSSYNPAGSAPQTIVSTHSPTLVAAVPADRVILFFTDPVSNQVRCNALARAGLTSREARTVRRMMDVTRASMYFAKGLILVEGVCEALLIPVLARRLNIDLAKEHVAVVPVCGVAFETFRKLLQPDAFGIRTAIVTDADPPLEGDADTRWQEVVPRADGADYELSPRTRKLVESFAGHPTVGVHHSKLTLEFDLADASDANPEHVAAAWERCFDGAPRTLTRAKVAAEGMTRREKALAVWRGVCLACSSGSKAELAQHLTDMLAEDDGCPGFVVPDYLAAAIRHVVPVRVPPAAPAGAYAGADV
jgi:putative ATP-dependent endonuclease of the OLD family